MANLTESPIYEPGIFQLEKLTPPLGGAPVIDNGVPSAGHANAQALQLANRTNNLNQRLVVARNDIDALRSDVDANGSAVNLADQLSGDTGANLVANKKSNSGSTKRTLKSIIDDFYFSPKDFGAIGDGVADDTAAFTAAAAAAGNNGTVKVRNGRFIITSLIPTKTNWDIDNTAVILGLPNITPAATMNTSRLQGTLRFRDGHAQFGKDYLGDPQYSFIVKRQPRASTIAAHNVISPSGRTGVSGMAMSSLGNDVGGTDQSCIAVQGLAINDNTTTPKPTWSGYYEMVKWSSGTGPAHGMEIDVANGASDTIDFGPYISRTIQDSIATGLSLGAGGGGSTFVNIDPISCFANMGPNGNVAKRGLVVLNGALTADRELFSTYARCGWKWYWPDTLAYADFSSHRYFQSSRSDTDAPRIRQTRSRATGATVTATQQFDIISAQDSFAFNGSSETQAAYQQIVQRSAWSGGNAQMGWQLWCAGAAGANRTLEFNNSVASAFHPGQSGVTSLGAASYLWSQVFASTATISTSDERYKKEISNIDELVLDAWATVDFKQFKMADAVKEKGEEARWHFGVIAQKVKKAFEKQGLDPFAYGILCYDSWDAQEEIVQEWDAQEEIVENTPGERDENDEWIKMPEYRVVQEGRQAGKQIMQEKRSAGNRYGIRYEEALVLECALMRRTQSNLELRLKALENNREV